MVLLINMREFADLNLLAPPLPGAEFGLVTLSLQWRMGRVIPLVGGNSTCDLDHGKSSVDVHILEILPVFWADLIAVCSRHIRGWRLQTPSQVDHLGYVGHKAPARPLLRSPRELALACICSETAFIPRPICKDGGFNVHNPLPPAGCPIDPALRPPLGCPSIWPYASLSCPLTRPYATWTTSNPT